MPEPLAAVRALGADGEDALARLDNSRIILADAGVRLLDAGGATLDVLSEAASTDRSKLLLLLAMAAPDNPGRSHQQSGSYGA